MKLRRSIAVIGVLVDLSNSSFEIDDLCWFLSLRADREYVH
jgi:hypothetical protein